MNRRRLILSLGPVVLLAACAPSGGGPLVQGETTRGLSVEQVRVDTQALTGNVGRALTVSPAETASDIEATTRAALPPVPGQRPVRLDIAVQQVRLAPPLARGVGQRSQVVGVVQMTDVSSGQVIVQPTRVVGSPGRIPLAGVAGVISSPETSQDYEMTIAAFAVDLRRTVFGDQYGGGPV